MKTVSRSNTSIFTEGLGEFKLITDLEVHQGDKVRLPAVGGGYIAVTVAAINEDRDGSDARRYNRVHSYTFSVREGADSFKREP